MYRKASSVASHRVEIVENVVAPIAGHHRRILGEDRPPTRGCLDKGGVGQDSDGFSAISDDNRSATLTGPANVSAGCRMEFFDGDARGHGVMVSLCAGLSSVTV
jgi:hypothetical protein